MKKVISYLFIGFIVSFSMKGQSLDNLLVTTENLYKDTETKLIFPTENKSFTFKPYQIADSSYTHYQIQLKKEQQKVLKNDPGLVLKATTQYNLNGDLDIETNNFTNSRIKTEVEWNILKSGFLNNSNKVKQLENEIVILDTKKEREQRIAWRRQFRLQYTYSINEELIELFETKQQFLSRYFDVIAALYTKKRVKREKFLVLAQQLNITETELENTKQFNVQLKDSINTAFIGESLPLLEIDTLYFRDEFTDHNNNNLQKRNDSLRAQNVKLQHHWTNDVSLSAYANYNWLQTNVSNRNFASIGLKLRVPLRFSSKKNLIAATIARDQAFYK
ncbi:MAG: hypothetical protein HRU35_08390, partial [Rickettsiaceae bacterium]|nr:hypothetical protein [Rickettsiaceae bacterium]